MPLHIKDLSIRHKIIAVSLALAERLGAHVTGVDYLAPFVAIAEAEAQRRGLHGVANFLSG